MLYIPDSECPHLLSVEFNNTSMTNSSQMHACCTELYNRCVCVFITVYYCCPVKTILQLTHLTKWTFSHACVCVSFAVWQCMSHGTWQQGTDSVRAVCWAAARSRRLNFSTAALCCKSHTPVLQRCAVYRLNPF